MFHRFKKTFRQSAKRNKTFTKVKFKEARFIK